jgi:hypothetical protein
MLDYFKRAYDRLFRKKTRRTIWGQKFDGYVRLTSASLQGRIELHSHNGDK